MRWCHHAQSADPAEVRTISRCDTEPVRQRCGGDPEVVCADPLAPSAQVGPHLGVDARDGFGDRDRFESGQQMLDECTPSCPLRSRRPMYAVEQLADRDHADGALLVPNEQLECGGSLASLPLDQQTCVDQDGQGLSGAVPASRRIRRTSSANSSSTGGAVARSSRTRAAETRRTRGGVITATGAPARVTSISSPWAMRFNTSEKLRATSVAVRRTMPSGYPINLIPESQFNSSIR